MTSLGTIAQTPARPARRTAVRLSELPATGTGTPGDPPVLFVTNAVRPRPSLGRRNEAPRRPVLCAVLAPR
ncbi:hypothetical protein GCM10023340_00200 [Nocardioides marinquilinus]|uniref:Uncharacterized protein n=1 Tax=Nocardioides marinquilinus TaxID=1210400 RepID=A0ABP9PA02_9ACTN